MLLLPFVLVAAVVSPAAAACQRQCGDVRIPFPFGIGRGCYLRTGAADRAFELACRTSSGPLRPTTAVDGFEVLHIDELRGKIRVRSPISSSCSAANQSTTLSYGSSAFRVSGADNVLVAVGCDASAYVDMWDSQLDNSYRAACRAVCVNGGGGARQGSACNGTDGCCQAPIPPRIMYFRMGFSRDGKSSSGECSRAMLVEKAAFKFPTIADGQVSAAVLDWTAGKERCRDAQRNATAYACAGANSECVDSDNGTGYLCRCAEGYQGNPYLPGDCQGQFSFSCSDYSVLGQNQCSRIGGTGHGT